MATQAPDPQDTSAADTGSTPALRCFLLGGFRVLVGTRAVADDEWRLLKARALVKLLALAPGHRFPREQLMDTLWPEADAAAARRNFNYALHVARHALDRAAGADPEARSLLHLQDGVLILATPGGLTVDVERFTNAVAHARRTRDPADYRAALAHYVGELLPDDRYEEWASGPRETLREAFLLALLELARLHEADGDDNAATEPVQRALQIAPAHEEAHTLLMRLYDRTGQRARALRQYARLREALQQELAVEPDPETQRLYAAILAGQTRHAGRNERSRPPPEQEGSRAALPTPLDPFIGRERELAELLRLLHGAGAQARLVTLTGTGGSGKTRLAIETAHRLLPHFPDTLWLVELASLDDPARLPAVVARSLGLREQPGVTPTALLLAALRRRPTLLLLDNCEHLHEASAQLALALLSACPQLRIMATSREPLGLPGELVWRVPSLALPAMTPGANDALAAIGASDAVSFFARHAALRDPAFRLTAENAPAVVALCQRLDGLPLALELAAGRLPGLAPGDLTARLDNALTILTSDGEGRTSRQRTLRATLDWSHSLLTPAEAALFRRLAVFGGVWTLPTAEAVCADATLVAGTILSLLVRLVDCSLVMVVSGKLETRYRLPETIRQYARERLDASGEQPLLEEHHATHTLSLVELAASRATKTQQVAWLDRVESEHDNLRAALRWTIEQRQLDYGERFGSALELFWRVRGHYHEGHVWLGRLLTIPEADSRLPLLRVAGQMAYMAGAYATAQQLSQRLVIHAKLLGDNEDYFGGLLLLGNIALHRGDYATARDAFMEGSAKAHANAAEGWITRFLVSLGYLKVASDQPTEATELLEEGLIRLRMNDETANISATLNLIGAAAFQQGDLPTARAYQEASLAQAATIGHRRGLIWSQTYFGFIAVAQDDRDLAHTLFDQALQLAWEQRVWWYVAACLDGFAELAAAQGLDERALRLHAAAEALRERMGIVSPTSWDRHYIPAVAALRATVGTAPPAAWLTGQTLGLEEAIDEARTGK